MIKYLGSIGTFIRLNDNDNKTYQLLNVYSSSAAQLSLFSAGVNPSTGQLIYPTASVSCYVNGVSGSSVPSQKWAHLTFSFDDKLATYDKYNFLIRFGDTASSNFNIQNTYILENTLNQETVEYLHQEFTGAGNKKLQVADSALFSLNIIDTEESNYISSVTRNVYQPLNNQNRFTYDVAAATTASLSMFVSASLISADDLYIDGHLLQETEKVLSFTESQIYELTGSATLKTVSSSVGDFVKIAFGQEYRDLFYLYTASGFQTTQGVLKINSIVNRTQ
jgi:hypothetical protein